MSLKLTALPFALTLTLAAPGLAQQQLARLLPADGFDMDLFGDSVGISGERVIVGAKYHPDYGFDAGAAYIFDASSGAQLHELLPLGVQSGDNLGHAVAIHGNLAVATAPFDNEMGQAAGAAFVFDVATGNLLWKLVASDALAGDFFGSAIDISEDYIVVGASHRDDSGYRSGAAYVFSTSTGLELYKLLASDGAVLDSFGASVAVDRNRIVVGAPRNLGLGPGPGQESGAAYAFAANSGNQLYKLLPSDGLVHEQFGYSVALEGKLTVVGEPNHGVPFTRAGAAFVFDVTTGLEISKLQASDAAAFDTFGFSVTISGQHAVIPAEGDDDNGSSSGSAYIFEVRTGLELGKFAPSDGTGGERFGRSVSLDGTRLAVGVPNDSEAKVFTGSAYTFELPVQPGTAYCFGDGSGTFCPCVNAGAVGRGCASGTSSEGCLLFGTGFASVAQDSFKLVAIDAEPGQFGVFFEALNRVQGGAGQLFGDGLRCAGGSLVRMSLGTSDATGLRWSNGGHGAALSAGAQRRYQYWYRNPTASPCGANFNLSNGYEVEWLP